MLPSESRQETADFTAVDGRRAEPAQLVLFINGISWHQSILAKISVFTNQRADMAVGPTNSLYLLLVLFSATVATSSGLRSVKAGDEENSCVYTFYIRTGSIWKGGTDSKISVALAGSDGWGVQITDIEDWGGLMGDGYNYFERGNLDIFSGRGPCLASPPCWLNLTSEASGEHHGWYCNYVEVITSGPHRGCYQSKFTIEQWLATDVSPHLLYATRDYCPVGGENVSAGPELLQHAVGSRRETAEREE